ncbi:MAG: hypothetical protein D6785_03930, partial [Planctomycetota bacterium]
DYSTFLQTLERKKTEAMEILHKKTAIQNQLASLKASLKSLEMQKERLDERIQEAKSKEQELLYLRDQREKELKEVEDEFGLLQEEEKMLVKEIEKNEEEEALLAKEYGEDQGRLARLESRLEVLSQLSLDEMEEGQALLLEAKEKGELEGIFEPLIHLIQADLEYAQAIEACLDRFLYGLVVKDLKTARLCRDYLQKKESEGVLLLPVEISMASASKLPKGVLSPLEVIEFEPFLEPLLSNLFLGFGLVDNLDRAYDLLSQSKCHFVTRRGELLYSSGILKAVSGKGDHKKSKLAQISEMVEIKREYEGLKEKVEKNEKKLKRLRELLHQHRSHLQETKREISERQMELVRLRSAYQQILEKVDDQKNIQDSYEVEWEEAQQDVLAAEKKIKELESQLESLEKEGEK